jgi:TonB family protein
MFQTLPRFLLTRRSSRETPVGQIRGRSRWHIEFLLWIVATILISLTCLGRLSGVADNEKSAEKAPIAVSPEDAAKNLTKKVEPVYPPLAKLARIQGKVQLRVVVSEAGKVVDLRALSGQPLLAKAALDAAKEMEYKPLIVDGRAVSFTTQVDVPFSLGIPEEKYKEEQRNSADYFKKEDECRSKLKLHEYAKAEETCRLALDAAEKLPLERQNERRLAHQNMGYALFYEKKFNVALVLFQHEVEIGQKSLQPYDAELGYAYRDVARGYHVTGDPQAAETNYKRAIDTLRQARGHIKDKFLEDEYSKAIKSVLRDYVTLLDQSGQTEAAAKVRQEAEATQ